MVRTLVYFVIVHAYSANHLPKAQGMLWQPMVWTILIIGKKNLFEHCSQAATKFNFGTGLVNTDRYIDNLICRCQYIQGPRGTNCLNLLLIGKTTRKRFNAYVKLVVLRTNTKFGDRCFSVSGPAEWNALPHNIRDASLFDIFNSRLKTLVWTFIWQITCFLEFIRVPLFSEYLCYGAI